MKRFFKLAALVLVIAVSAVSLSSCRALDEAKEKRAVYTDDTYAEISCCGAVYRGIEEPNKTFLLIDYDYGYSVTTPDVPVLLADWYGDSAYLNNDGIILCVYSYHYNKFGEQDHKSDYNIYVREDKYDEVQQAIKEAKLDHYYFRYTEGDAIYDEHTNSIKAAEEKYALLNDEVTAAVNKALDSPQSERIKFKELGGRDTEYEVIPIFVCDKDMLLTQNDIVYHLLRVKGNYYLWNGLVYDDYGVCQISKDDSECIEKLYRDYPGAIDRDTLGRYLPY